MCTWYFWIQLTTSDSSVYLLLFFLFIGLFMVYNTFSIRLRYGLQHLNRIDWGVYVKSNQSYLKWIIWVHINVDGVVSLQASAFLQRPSSPGRDHVQREHASLAAENVIRQVSQCSSHNQPRGPHHLSVPVSTRVIRESEDGVTRSLIINGFNNLIQERL